MQDGSLDRTHAFGTGYERVNCEISSVLTRFRLRSALALPLFYLAFRRIRKHACVPGLLKVVFMVESPRTCYTLSIWLNDLAIAEFNKQIIHIAMANWSFRHIYRFNRGYPELWSTQWKLFAVSQNLKWDGFTLRDIIGDSSPFTVGNQAH